MTSSGQNTLGFLVEGKAWVPKWDKYTPGEGGGRKLNAQFNSLNKPFQLSAGIKINGKISYFQLYIYNLYATGTFTSNCTISLGDSNGMFIRNGGDYDNVCGPNTSFSLTIRKLDTTNKIVSGIFQARLRKRIIWNFNTQDIYPNSPEFIEIKDGLFDVRYY